MKPSRNLWPLGIVAAFVLFIGGTVALIVVACSNGNQLVTPDYYERELRHQAQMDRVERTQQLPSPASVRYDSDARQITVSLPADHAASASGQIELYRPSEAGLDRRLHLQLDAAGRQTIDASALRAGLWKVKVTWSSGGEEFSMDAKVVIERKQT